jgi:signal transduction histidine kinase
MSSITRRRLLDVAPTFALLALGAVSQGAAYESAGFQGPHLANAGFLVAAAVPLVFRRSRPALVLAVVFIVQALWVALYYHGTHQPPFEPFAAGVVACFALGFHADRRALRVGIGIFIVLVAGTAVTLAIGGAAVGDALPALLWWAGAVVLGRTLRDRQALIDLLRDRSTRLERDRERDLAAAAADERARIARELHDVIAHAVSLIVIQAGAERRVLEPGQERTRETLEAIEGSGREALGELRRLLGILRVPAGERLSPQPSLAGVPDLLCEAQAAGQAVELRETGTPVPLAPGLDLNAYRILQEALTNARKHAPGTPVAVTLAWSERTLDMEVVDQGSGSVAAPGGRPGHGLVGMRERALMYGGNIEAGPAPQGGFRVRAELPIERRVAD